MSEERAYNKESLTSKEKDGLPTQQKQLKRIKEEVNKHEVSLP